MKELKRPHLLDFILLKIITIDIKVESVLKVGLSKINENAFNN